MHLRSGKIYTIPSVSKSSEPRMCVDCDHFWGNPNWDMKCSVCSIGYCNVEGVSPYWGFKDPEYQKKLTNWVNCATKDNERYIPILKSAAKQLNTTMLKEILSLMRDKLIFITAEQAFPLLRNIGTDTNEKSHLIGQFIIDWWNMKKYPYNGTEMCYFGNFGDEPETKNFPPRLPNGSFPPWSFKYPELPWDYEFVDGDTDVTVNKIPRVTHSSIILSRNTE